MATEQNYSASSVGYQVAGVCDELNNVLTGIMLRTGLLHQAQPSAALVEIEQLSIRARSSVEKLRTIADSLTGKALA